MRWNDDKDFNKLLNKFNSNYNKFLKNKSNKDKLSKKGWNLLNKTIDQFEELLCYVNKNKYQGWLAKEQLTIIYEQCDNLILWSEKYQVDGVIINLLQQFKELLADFKTQEMRHNALEGVGKHLSKIARQEIGEEISKNSDLSQINGDIKFNGKMQAPSQESKEPFSPDKPAPATLSETQQTSTTGNPGTPLSAQQQNSSTEISISIPETQDEHNDPQSQNFLVDIFYRIKDFIVNLSNNVINTVKEHPRLFIGIGVGGVVLLFGGIAAAIVIGKMIAAPTLGFSLVAHGAATTPATYGLGNATIWLLTELFPLTMATAGAAAIGFLNYFKQDPIQNENSLIVKNTYNHLHKKFDDTQQSIEINEQDQINLPASLAKLENELSQKDKQLDNCAEILSKYSQEKRDLNNRLKKLCKEFLNVRQSISYIAEKPDTNDNCTQKPLPSDTLANLSAKRGNFRAEDENKKTDKTPVSNNISNNFNVTNNK